MLTDGLVLPIDISSNATQDLFETVGPAIDGIKFVGGSPHVLTRSAIVELIEISHARFVYVCESGLLQHALAQVRHAGSLYPGQPHGHPRWIGSAVLNGVIVYAMS